MSGRAGKVRRRAAKTWTLTSAMVALAGLTTMLAVAAPAAAGAGADLGGLRERGRAHGSSGGPLVDHGGPILPVSHTYAVFWGSSNAWATDVQGGLASFFTGLNASSFLNTDTQYARGASVGSAFAGSASDSSAPPKQVSPSTLGAEVAKVFGANIDPNGVYFVYTANFPKGGGFCAWHSFTSVAGQDVAVAYMPNTTGVSGCDPGNLYNLSGSEGLRSLANVTSHEFMEAVTDPLPASATYAWIDAQGAEIGDKCAWRFASPVTLSNHTVWQLQTEWSDAAAGCVETTP